MISGYPRPQLVRAGHVLLDGEWGYATDPDDLGLAAHWESAPEAFARTITVPFPPESPASGVGEDPDGALWYRREFAVDTVSPGRLLLHFEGVDHSASVWLNGIRIGDHEGSQARFTVDGTHAVQPGVNVLVVRVVDDPGDLEQPRGKQDWQPDPHVIWYRRTSGIWRSVWWEWVPATRIDRLLLTPGEDLRTVGVSVSVAGPLTQDMTLGVELTLGPDTLARAELAVTSGTLAATLTVDDPRVDAEPDRILWSPDSPTLVDARLELRQGGDRLDVVTSYLGLRSVATDHSRVLLNGRPLFLRLVLEQGYWPETHLASPSTADLEREVQLIRELGFNGLRMHQTSADPRFLECCDRAGLVVLADAAAAYRFSPVALSRTSAELAALVARDAGHPSVIGWVAFNESWGLPGLQVSRREQHAVEALYHYLKALDPTRLVIGNDGWHFTAGDLVGIHDYTHDPRLLARRYGSPEQVRAALRSEQPAGRPLVLPPGQAAAANVPVLLSEFGGLNVHTDDGAWSGYGEVITATQLPQSFAELLSSVGPDSGLAGYCYTQLTDTAQEKNGLLTECREHKAAPSLLRSPQG